MPGNDPVNFLPDSNLALFHDRNANFMRNELPQILYRYGFSAFVFSGGLHGTIAGKVSMPFPVDAFSSYGNRITADGFDGSVAIDYGAMGAGDDDLAYVIASAQIGDILGNFQRVGTSNYFVNCVDIPSSPPVLPVDSVWLMEVSISGGNIISVRDIRNRHPLGNIPVSVKDFGATGGGVTNDRVAIQNAFAMSKTVFFPEGNYYVGDYSGVANVIDLSPYGNGIRIKTEGVVTLICSASGAGNIPIVFYLENNSNFYCEPICFQGIGIVYGSISSGITGPGAFRLNNPNNIDWGNITFESITCHSMVLGIECTGVNGILSAGRLHGIHIGQLNITECYYGLNCQADGDDIFGNIVAHHCVRPYFPWGVRDHIINVFNRNPRGSTGQCAIATIPGSIDTKGIILNYTCRESTAEHSLGAHVLFQHTDLLGHEISGVKVNVNIHDTSDPYYPVAFKNYTGSGGAETTAPSQNIVRDIQLSGSCDANALPIPVIASYLAKRQMHFIPGLNFLPSPGIFNQFQLCQLVRSATDITWGATVANPVVGNGVLKYDMDIMNGMVFMSIYLEIGTTTDIGEGEWYFSSFLLSTYLNGAHTTSNRQGSWFGNDFVAGVYRCGTCFLFAGGDIIQCALAGGTTLVSHSVPHSWAPQDKLELTIAFPID